MSPGALSWALVAVLCVLVLIGIGAAWGQIARKAELSAEIEEYRQLRRDFLYPVLAPHAQAQLDAIAASSAVLSTALRFRGQLLADKIRKKVNTPDIGLALVMHELMRCGDSIEVYALSNELDPYTTLRHVLAAAVTELSALSREVQQIETEAAK